MVHEILSERVKAMLEEKSISQKVFAERLGIDYITLWRKLKGERKLDADFLKKLAQQLDTSVAYLLGETDEPSLRSVPTAARLKERRTALEYDEARVASAVGVTQNYIEILERGTRTPSKDILKRLAETLRTSVAYLTGETDDPAPASRSANQSSQENRPSLQASQDLDEIIRDLAHKNPDLIVQLRDTRENWDELSDQAKQVIADGLKYVLGMAELDDLPKLRKRGRRGRI